MADPDAGRKALEAASERVATMHRERRSARGKPPTLTAKQIAADRRAFLASGGRIRRLPGPGEDAGDG